MTTLNVAEKPSVARSISSILSTNCSITKGKHKYCSNISFDYDGPMIFTSVLGHLFSIDFADQRRWNEMDPIELFDAEIISNISKDMAPVAENIKQLSRKCSRAIIWTDCDREGENIARQIQSLIPGLSVFRARFSAITRNEIESALSNLQRIDENAADAVDARMELDLRIGSAFTRLQTLSCNFSSKKIISFGPCQIPTLNFVVQRHFQILNFIPEKYYSLEAKVNNFNSKIQNVNNSSKSLISENYSCLNNQLSSRNKVIKSLYANNKNTNNTNNSIINSNNSNSNNVNSVFKWKRGNLFDKNIVIHFHSLLANERSVIVDKKITQRTKLRPLPLRTVEFQKICSSYFKMSGHKLMEIAEKLYNSGYISYPRTETDSYPRDFNFNSIISKLKSDDVLGDYASSFTFCKPRSGKSNDQAHSPIYPLKSGSSLGGDERKVYDFIARRFLGSISKDAKGVETEYTMNIYYKNTFSDSSGSCRINNSGGDAKGSYSNTAINKSTTNRDINNIINTSITDNSSSFEVFTLKGLTVTERNFLEIYTFDKWESVEIEDFQVNQIVPVSLEIVDGSTTKPEYLSESDLITLMDKNGIGTDATIHEHILKIQTRGYAKKVGQKIIPLNLGINLIKAYNVLELNVSEPVLRKSLEENLVRISEGQKDKDSLIKDEIVIYKRIYKKLQEGIEVFKNILSNTDGDSTGDDNNGDDSGDNDNGGFKNIRSKSNSKNKNNFEEKRKRRKSDDSNENVKNTYKIKQIKNINLETKNTDGNKNKENKYNTNRINSYSTGSTSHSTVSNSGTVNNGSTLGNGNTNSSGYNTVNNSNTKNSTFTMNHYNSITSKTVEKIKCNCKKEAKKVETKKGEHAGRFFYSCFTFPKACNFFKWADEVDDISNNFNNFNNNQLKSNVQVGNSQEDIKCYCGYDVAKKTANTENNKGRSFYVCNKNYKKCNFFQWVD